MNDGKRSEAAQSKEQETGEGPAHASTARKQGKGWGQRGRRVPSPREAPPTRRQKKKVKGAHGRRGYHRRIRHNVLPHVWGPRGKSVPPGQRSLALPATGCWGSAGLSIAPLSYVYLSNPPLFFVSCLCKHFTHIYIHTSDLSQPIKPSWHFKTLQIPLFRVFMSDLIIFQWYPLFSPLINSSICNNFGSNLLDLLN